MSFVCLSFIFVSHSGDSAEGSNDEELHVVIQQVECFLLGLYSPLYFSLIWDAWQELVRANFSWSDSWEYISAFGVKDFVKHSQNIHKNG